MTGSFREGAGVVVFVLTPQVHLLDLAGLAQVFSTAPGYTLRYVADSATVPTLAGRRPADRRGLARVDPG